MTAELELDYLPLDLSRENLEHWYAFTVICI